MKIIMGADFGGYDLKQAIKADLLAQGYEITDLCPDGPMPYQDAAVQVAQGVQSKSFDRGIVICGTGMGVSIIANKFRGVYAALCESVYTARRSRAINNTNVLCMGGFVVGHVLGCEMANAWLQAEYLQGLKPQEVQRCGKEFLEIPKVEETVYANGAK